MVPLSIGTTFHYGQQPAQAATALTLPTTIAVECHRNKSVLEPDPNHYFLRHWFTIRHQSGREKPGNHSVLHGVSSPRYKASMNISSSINNNQGADRQRGPSSSAWWPPWGVKDVPFMSHRYARDTANKLTILESSFRFPNDPSIDCCYLASCDSAKKTGKNQQHLTERPEQPPWSGIWI